jgi:outer membrane protein assembly factor BamD
MSSTRSKLALLLVLAVLPACSSTGSDELAYVERPAEQIYNEAMGLLGQEEFRTAARTFDEVERQHPYSPWAVRAQLMSAFALYEGQRFDEAIAALDRFISLNPGNERVDYAYYLRALCYYEQIQDIERDQRMTENARAALTEVAQRYPNSAYGRDAALKLDLTLDHLAGKEMDVGRFYLRQGQYQAAIGRFQRVIQNYETTNQVPEALHRLSEAYLALGLVEEARKSAAVLGYNFPGSEWYTDSYRLLVEGAFVPAAAGATLPPRESRGRWWWPF